MDQSLQYHGGHHPDDGWIVWSNAIDAWNSAGGGKIKCESQLEVNRLKDALQRAYQLGRADVQNEMKKALGL